MTSRTQYDPDVGRPKKRPEEQNRTPARSWKPPPDLYERFRAATIYKEGENKMTTVLVRLATAYTEEVEREQQKEAAGDE